MDGLQDYAKWKKSDRRTNPVWYHLYVESKNNPTQQASEYNKNKQTHRYWGQTSVYQWGEGSGEAQFEVGE